RLFANDGTPIGNPPTCFVAVAYKMAERKSLNIEERRPSTPEKSSLKISAMRDQKTGAIVDVVSRELSLSEILPYRVDSEGYLKVYLHDGLARSIANAVPRGGINIDGRLWSGHMIEPISVDADAFAKMEAFDVKHSVLFARDFLGLKPKVGEVLTKGPDYYPAPDFIDEKIQTYYMHVEKAKGHITPKNEVFNSYKFQAKGIIRELDAQQVLDAITIGMIPNARIELQILSLFQYLKIKPENWVSKKIDLQLNRLANQKSSTSLLKAMGEPDERFKAIKGTAGELRPIHSTFVEEGHSRGSLSGLTSENVDFIVHDGKTLNTAVILPLTKDLKGDIHAGFNTKYLPVPQRYEGTGMTACLPSLDIPPEIQNFKQLKKFIANEYGITPASVIKMGESYHMHIGITPQRIYPFAIAAPPSMMKDPDSHFLPFYQMMLLKRALSKQPHFMVVLARAYRYFHDDLRLDARLEAKAILKQRFENMQPVWSMPIHFDSIDMMREHIDDKVRQQRAAQELERIEIEENEHHKKMLEEEERQRQDMENKLLDEKKRKPFHAQNPKKKKPLPKLSGKAKAQLTSPPPFSLDPRALAGKNISTPEAEPDEFEQELEAFMDEFEQEIIKPTPEKW
nr:hypothetical protein [Micavibrio sp.]